MSRKGKNRRGLEVGGRAGRSTTGRFIRRRLKPSHCWKMKPLKKKKSFQLSDVFRETLKLNCSLNEKRGPVCARKEEEPDPNALLIYERRVLPMEEKCGRPRSRFRGGSMQSAIIYSGFFLVVL